jgi:hypothetical protein
MPFHLKAASLNKSPAHLRRWLRYTFYDWTREMSRSKRIITYVGILLHGYAFYFMLMWAFILPKWCLQIFCYCRDGQPAM